MDLSTIIGIIMGSGLVIAAILMNSGLGAFIDPASAAVVIGGAASAVLISTPLGQVTKMFKVVKNAFFSKPADLAGSVTTLVKLAEVARRDGILSLESQLSEGDYDPFLAQA